MSEEKNWTVFVVSDNAAVRDSILELVASAGLRAEAFSCLESLRGSVRPERCACLVLDANARELASAERLGGFAAICAKHPVLLLIDRGDVPVAVRAIRDGAVDVLEKPCRDETLLERIRRAVAAGQGSPANR